MLHELMTFFQTALPFELIMAGLLLVVWIIVIIHTLLFYFRLSLFRAPRILPSEIPLTILMVERNEEENL